MPTTTSTTKKTIIIEECDYLVVGAGAATMAFIDTILTELPTARMVLVDKKAVPGGQWVDAYGFVHLHHPSLLYGVASRSLEGSWYKLLLWNWILPWTHRASKTEILTHFEKFVKDKVAAGQVSYYPNCAYSFDRPAAAAKKDDDIHSFTTLDGSETYSVKVRVKVVNGVLGECKVPSQYPVEFPVDEGITVVTPNDIHDGIHSRKKDLQDGDDNKRFVVLGAGKTAMDTIVYLQRMMKVKPKQIMWIISNDVWMLAREGEGNPFSWCEKLIKCKGDRSKACLSLEEEGLFVRVDKNILPSKFKFPVIGKDELALLRRIPFENQIRRGRVTSMRLGKGKQEDVIVGFGPQQDDMVINSSKNTVFVHCTSPGPFNGNENMECFESDKMLNMNYLYAPPVSLSMSCLGFLEAARRKGTLDASFAIELQHALEGKVYDKDAPTTAEDIEKALRAVLKGISLAMINPEFTSTLNFALFLCLAHSDVSVGHTWMKKNRLSFLAIPGFKCKIYELISFMVENGEILGLDSKLAMMKLVRMKLKPLEGQ